MALQKGTRLCTDADGRAIQVASKCVFIDATGTPQVSPLTTVTTVKTFVPPANAVVFWFRATVAGRFGDNATLSGASSVTAYAAYDANDWLAVPCAGGGNVYVLPDSSATVSFRFEMIE